MKATLNDFGIKFKKVPMLCDNESEIKLTNNLVQHVRTKHIDVCRRNMVGSPPRGVPVVVDCR